MGEKVVPMIHVPDVRATVDWYKAIGFNVIQTYDDGGEGLSFAILSLGKSEVMFNSGGQPSSAIVEKSTYTSRRITWTICMNALRIALRL